MILLPSLPNAYRRKWISWLANYTHSCSVPGPSFHTLTLGTRPRLRALRMSTSINNYGTLLADDDVWTTNRSPQTDQTCKYHRPASHSSVVVSCSWIVELKGGGLLLLRGNNVKDYSSAPNVFSLSLSVHLYNCKDSTLCSCKCPPYR